MREHNRQHSFGMAAFIYAMGAATVFCPSVFAQLSLSPATKPASAATPAAGLAASSVEEAILEANTLYEQGHLDQARSRLSRLASEYPRSGAVWLALGKIYEASNNSNSAMESYTKAVQLEPEDPKTNLAIGALYVRRNLPRQAIRYLLKANQLEPNNAPTCAALGMALAQMSGEVEKKQALEMFAAAVRLAPNEPDYRFKLGLFLVADGNVKIGLDHLHQALAQSMEQLHAAPLDYHRSGQVEQFLSSLLDIYQQQAAKSKGDEQARYYLLVSEALKKRAELYYHRTLNEQRVWTLQAARVSPQNVEALAGYARISLALGLDNEVQEAVGRLVGLAPDDPRTKAIQKELSGRPVASQPTSTPPTTSQPMTVLTTSAPASQPAGK